MVVGGRVREWQWQQVVGLYGPACSHSWVLGDDMGCGKWALAFDSKGYIPPGIVFSLY